MARSCEEPVRLLLGWAAAVGGEGSDTGSIEESGAVGIPGGEQ